MAFLLVKHSDSAERHGLVLSAADAAWQRRAWRSRPRLPDLRHRPN